MPQESLIAGIIRSLRENKAWALLIIGLSVLCAYALNKYAPARYQSEALLRVLASETNDVDLTSTMRGILSQKQIISEIAKESGLNENKIKKESFCSLKNEGGSLIKLVVTHTDTEALKRLGDAVIKVLSQHFLAYNAEIKSFEIKSRQNKLAQLESAISAAITETEKLQNAQKNTVNEEALAIETSLQQLKDKIEAQEGQLQNMPDMIFLYQEEENHDYKTACQELQAERNKLAELFKTYKYKHPRVIACKKRIKELEKREKRLRTKVGKMRSNPDKQSLINDINSDKAKAEELKKQLAECSCQENNKKTPEENKLKALKIKLETLNELHKSALMQLEECKISQNASFGRINVLKKDARPPVCVGLSNLQRGIIVVSSGFLLAVLLLYSPMPQKTEPINLAVQPEQIDLTLFEETEPQIRQAEMPEKILNAPMLAPKALPLQGLGSLGDVGLKGAAAAANPDFEGLSGYKEFITNLQISFANLQTRVIAITSAREGVGTTSLFCNTAILTAKAGYSVIMLDASFRRPRLYKIFNCANEPGLADALQGTSCNSLIQCTSVNGLFLLTAGPSPNNPAEALGSQAMAELLSSLKSKFEIIFIDTPPLLEYPETAVLAGLDAAVIYLSPQNEAESELQAAKDLLNKVNARVLGWVKI